MAVNLKEEVIGTLVEKSLFEFCFFVILRFWSIFSRIKILMSLYSASI